jgi:hypothetical protein
MFAFLTPTSIDFLHLYKVFDQLTGHMTYFIFQPPYTQPKNPVFFKFFWAKNPQPKIFFVKKENQPVLTTKTIEVKYFKVKHKVLKNSLHSQI